MSRITFFLVAALPLLAAASPRADADIIRLTNGQSLDGVIVDETDTHLRLRVAWTGFVTLDRGAVKEIVREDDAANRDQLSEWEKNHQTSLQEERHREREEEERRRSGYFQYQGQWVTAAELAMLQEARVRQEQERSHEELKKLTDRIEALEQENRRLRDETTRQRIVVTQPGFIIQQPLFPAFGRPQSRGREFTDEQGNMVRVHRRDDELSATINGQQVDVLHHDEHLAYVDPAGTHHDLTPVHHD